MKQKLRLLMMTLLCAVVSTAWGESTTQIASATFDGKNANYTEGWTTTGTGKGRTDCIIIGYGENITSPSFDLSIYSKIKISIKARRYGSLSDSKATIDVSIGGTSVGTTDAIGTSATTQLDDIEFTPTSSMTAATLVFTCTNATSPGSSHGAGINSITITGITDAGETVEMPTFSPAAGTYTEAQTVSISCATTGATIYYTTNGNNPSASSSVYSTPITISETTTIKAIAIKDGVSSSVASATYTIKTEEPTDGTIIGSGEFNGKDEKYPEGWSTTGTGKGRTDCIIIGAGENITSPSFDLSIYSKIKISIKARRYGSLSGSKATIDVSIGGTSVGTVDATGTNASVQLDDIEFTPTSSMTAATLVFTCTNATSPGSTHGAGINSITITGITDAGETVEMPTFSPAAGTYTEAQTVSISCATTGATIYYTTNGNNPSASSSVYSTPITISETTTIKAIAIKDGVSSSVANATYTIEVPSTPITIAAARSQATGSVFTKGIVTSCVGKTAYIQDATAGICVYGNDNLILTIGDEITVQGTLSNYNGLLEITSPTCTVVSSGNTVTPEVKTIAEISNDIQGILVKIENANVTAIDGQNTTIEQEGNTIIVRGITGVEYSVGDIISLTGNVGCYNTVQIANPRDIIVSQDDTPSITVSKTSIDIPAEGADGTIEVTFTNVDPELTEVVFYDADGTTETTCDWIVAEIKGNNIEYLVDENEGEARTAYFKVHGLADNENDVYSELITITQAVAPQPYTVTITQPENGEIYVFYNDDNFTPIEDGDQVSSGSEVLISVTANKGYQIESVTVTDGAGQTVTTTEVEGEEGAAWTFIMPKSDVTIACTVTEIPEPSDEEWVLTDLAALTEDDIFVIVGDNGDTYAMSNDKGTSAAPTAVSVTISGDKITSAVADNIKWNISGNATDGYTFYPNGEEETWLYTINSNNGVRVGTNKDNKAFTIDKNYLYNTATSRYIGIYNSQDWRCYTSINSNIEEQTFGFYKLVKPEPQDEPFTFTISDRATDGETCYATIADLGAGYFKVEGNVEVSTVVINENKQLSYPITFKENDVLPGQGAYLVKGAAGEYTFPTAEEGDVPDIGENMLISTGEGDVSADDMLAIAKAATNHEGDFKFYKLSLNGKSEAGSVGFYWGAPKGAAFNYTKAHQAFLAVPQTGESIESGDDVAAYLFDGDKTGIYNVMATESESSDDTYTLSGIRVENKQLPKGIYIKNGKKVVVR